MDENTVLNMESSKATTDKAAKKSKKPIIIIGAVVLLLALCALVVYLIFFQEQPVLGAQVEPGNTVVIRISADQVSDLYGYQFKLEYDESLMEYDSLRSLIDDITWIFQKPFDGYMLVGATQVGDVQGYSAARTPVCEIVMVIKSNAPIDGVSISDINVVTMVDTEMDYIEDVENWSYEIVAG